MAAPVPSGPFVPPHQIGEHQGNSGRAFSLQRFNQGRIVKRIGVHFNSDNLRGISISYENGDRQTTGTLAGSYQEITLAPGEKITRASLWGNGRGTRTGRIYFETDRERTFNAGRDTRGQDEFPMNVGSGLLAGFIGRSGTDIFILAFVFVLPVQSTLISNVRFTLPSGDSIVPHTLVHDSEFTNEQPNRDVDWTFSNLVERTNSVTFSSSVTVEYGQSLSISAGIPTIAQVEATVSWGIGATRTWSRTNERRVGFSWDLSGTIGPGEQVTCSAVCQYGQADIRYTANVRHTFRNHPDWTYTDNGVLENAEYAFGRATARKTRVGNKFHEVKKIQDVEADVGNKEVKPRL